MIHILKLDVFQIFSVLLHRYGVVRLQLTRLRIRRGRFEWVESGITPNAEKSSMPSFENDSYLAYHETYR